MSILKTLRIENESKLGYSDEKLAAYQREILIKAK
jgi:hypothetical protein